MILRNYHLEHVQKDISLFVVTILKSCYTISVVQTIKTDYTIHFIKY